MVIDLAFVAARLGPLLQHAAKAALTKAFEPERDPVVLAVDATARRFSQFENLKPRLLRWATDPSVAAELSLAAGEAMDERPLVAGFIQHADFFVGSVEQTQEAAGEVLWDFTERLTDELARGADGHAILLRRLDSQSLQLNNAVGASRDELLARMERIEAVVRSTGGSNEQLIESASDEARLTLAGQLAEAFLVESAERLVEEVSSEVSRRGGTLRVRFLRSTVLGRCALRRADPGRALAAFKDAASYNPSDAATRLRVALALALTGDLGSAKREFLEVGRPPAADDRLLALWIAAADHAGADASIAAAARLGMENFGRLAGQAMAESFVTRGDPSNAVTWARWVLQIAPGDPQASWTLARALHVRATGHGGLIELLGAPAQSDLAEAERLYTDVLNQYRYVEVSEVRRLLLSERAACRGILGREAEALRDAESVLDEFPEDVDALRIKANVLQRSGQHHEAVRMLLARRIDDPAASMVLGEAQLAAGQTREAVSTLLPLLADREGDLRTAASATLAQAYDALGEDTGLELLNALVEGDPNNPTPRVVRAQRLARRGCVDEAEDGLRQQIEVHEDSSHLKLALAELLVQQRRYMDAVLVYRELSPTPGGRLARAFLSALVNAREYAEALELARAMQKIDPADGRAIEVEAAVLAHAGSVDEAITAYRSVLALDPARTDLRLSLIDVLLRARREDEALRELASLSNTDLVDDPESLFNAAAFLAGIGDSRALQVAHRARRLGDANPSAHLRYMGLLLGLRNDDLTAAAPDRVARGTSVELTAAGRTLALYILDAGETPLHERELDVSFPLSRKLLGLSRGSELHLDEGIAVGDWTVSGIFSKWQYQLRDTLSSFETRFGPNAGLQRLSIQEGDVGPILEALDQRREYVDRALDTYNAGHLTFSTLATMLGLGPLELWRSAGRSLGSNFAIRSQPPNPLGATLEAELDGHRGTVVLDAVALISAAHFELIPLLKQMYSRVLVPQQVVDDLFVEGMRSRVEGARLGRLGARGDGTYFMSEPSEVEGEEHRQALDRVLAACSVLEVVGVESSLRLARDPRFSQLVEVLGRDTANVLELARESKALVLSDDWTTQRIAAAEFGVGAYSMQEVIRSASRRNLNDDLAELDFATRAAEAGYVPVRISSQALAFALSGGPGPMAIGVARQFRGDVTSKDTAALMLSRALYSVFLLPDSEPWLPLLVDQILAVLGTHDASPGGAEIAAAVSTIQTPVRDPKPLVALLLAPNADGDRLS